MEMRLGLAGTAKNTGKTTTTAAVIQELRSRGMPFYLTSIGYDGENLDNITGLPKPKLRVKPGDMVVTAEKCLLTSTAGLQVLHMTALRTPLGRIGVARVVHEGLVVTAGPNKTSEVKALSELLRQFGPGICIFDGALNRIAPMAQTDGFILATGAAKTPDIARLAAETEMMWYITNLPAVPESEEIKKKQPATVTLYDPSMAKLENWSRTSLLNSADVEQVLRVPCEEWSYLYIPGVIATEPLQLLTERLEQAKRKLILCFADPIKIIVSGEISVVFSLMKRLDAAGVLVGVASRTPLLAVTINPFYPDYRLESHTYQPAYVDMVRLQMAVQKKIKVPVYNVMRQGAAGLVDQIIANAVTWESHNTIQF